MSASERMSAGEFRAAIGLAGIFGLRMLGLFAILPVFALYAGTLEGGHDLTLVGIALGAYGLAQAVLQIPFGRWSDRIGRKPILYAGLVLFALGSVIAGYASSIHGVILGRLLQGSGAISAVAIAMAADLTRDEHRTKVMAIIGSMIGFSFVVSLVLGPWLSRVIGVPGIFYSIGALALAAMAVVASLPRPSAPAAEAHHAPAGFGALLRDPELGRLNIGIFVLHAVLMSLFVTVPSDLVAAGMGAAEHWKVYAVVMLGATALMAPAVYFGDRRGHSKPVFLAAIVLVAASQALLIALNASLAGMVFALLVFFTGFMVLEAALPSQVSRVAPPARRGTAIAVYSTVQFLGAFCGGALGGYLMQHFGLGHLLVANLALVALWLACAVNMRGSDKLSARTFTVPVLHGEKALGLREQLGALPGVREARLQAGGRVAYLKVDVARFDEREVLKLIAGER